MDADPGAPLRRAGATGRQRPERHVDPIEQLACRQRSVAPDPADPAGFLATRPNGSDSVGGAARIALDLAEPVRQHLRDVGEDLLRTPVGLRLRAVSLAERPRLATSRPHREGRPWLRAAVPAALASSSITVSVAREA